MEKFPTQDEFEQYVDPEHGIWDPQGEIIKTRNRTHAVAILAGAYINSFHHRIAQIMAAKSISGRDPLRRTDDTLNLLDQIEFGDSPTALKAANSLWAIHTHLTSTMEDGSPVSATEPNLLSASLVGGFRTTASQQALMHSHRSHKDVLKSRDQIFASYWVEYERQAAAVGIPAGYLPSDPGAAIDWWAEELRANMVIDANQNSVEGFVKNYTATAVGQTDISNRIQNLFQQHLEARVTTEMVKAVAYYAAPDPIPEFIYPKGVPVHVRAELLAAPLADRFLPDWFFGNVPHECPEAARVMARVVSEEHDRLSDGQ